MSELVLQKDLEKFVKKYQPPPATERSIRATGLVEHVKKYAVSVAEIYMWCRHLGLEQEVFTEARAHQLARLRRSIERILKKAADEALDKQK